MKQNYELINKDSSYAGIYRAKVFENEGNIRVYIPGISQINPFDSNGNLIEDIVSQNISAFPIAQWCAYNLESCDLANISEPMWCMFEGGDVKRPVIISYTFPKNVIMITVYVGGGSGIGSEVSVGVYDGEYIDGDFEKYPITGNSRGDYIYNELRKAGLSIAGAAAVLGNLSVESTTFYPGEVFGSHRGIAQWDVDRWNNLSSKYDFSTLEGQTAGLIDELQHEPTWLSKTNGNGWNSLLKGTNVTDLTDSIRLNFERCNDQAAEPRRKRANTYYVNATK